LVKKKNCIFDKKYQNEFDKMNSIGETIRNLQTDKQLPLRIVAAYLDIDQAILSRIERGEHKATR